MKPIRKLKDLFEAVKLDKTPTVAVAAGQDPDTIIAISRAVREDVVKAILVGDEKQIQNVIKLKKLDPSHFTIVHSAHPDKAAEDAIKLVNEGQADMLMKGLVKTTSFMKFVLHKDSGLLPPDGLLSHVSVIEIPAYPKLIIFSDAAIIPEPNLEQKIQILKYTIEVAYALGIELPKAALISASETVSPKIQSSVDAAIISAMSQRKQISGAIVDGPLAFDVSISPEHCAIKGLESPVRGEADILIFPNIEAANTFYKCNTLFAQGTVAAIVVGTKVPVILTSRADEEDSKFYSIALAARLSAKRLYGNAL